MSISLYYHEVCGTPESSRIGDFESEAAFAGYAVRPFGVVGQQPGFTAVEFHRPQAAFVAAKKEIAVEIAVQQP